MEIVSPVSGFVDRVDEFGNVLFVIRTTDDHEVRAPVSGEVTRIEGEGGVFEGDRWTVQAPKTERLTFEIGGIEFKLEVGKPRYVTDTVRVDAKVGDVVERGHLVAEILLGSRAELVAPSDPYFEVLVRPGDSVRAGETAVYKLPATVTIL